MEEITVIYITGDTHIPVDIQKLATKRFPEQKEMTKNDYLIICGDVGGVWDGSNEEKYWIKWLKNKNFTTLFVDGNHENFDKLSSLPVIDFCGATAHKVDDGIYHLMRGSIYTIDNKTFFTFGGASSHDKECRKEGKNWWKEELPTNDEYENAEDALSMHNWAVDYIITHCAPNSIQRNISPMYQENELTDFFEKINHKLKFKQWFFGHYHIDKKITDKHICVFNEIIYIVSL